MLVVAFGTSTAVGYFGFTAAAAVLDVAFGGHHKIHCIDLPGLQRGWDDWDKRFPVLVTSDKPDAGLAQMLISSKCAYYAFLDDPVHAVLSAMQTNNFDARRAIAFSVDNFCALGSALPRNNLLLFRAEVNDATVESVLRSMLEHIVHATDETVRKAVLKLADYNALAAEGRRVRELLDNPAIHNYLPRLPEVSAADMGLIEDICESYGPVLEGQDTEMIAWAPELFEFDKHRDASNVIDLSGPARCLIWGPYLNAPAGKWIAEVMFETTENVSGNEVIVDVCQAVAPIAIGQTSLPHEGFYICRIPFDLKNSQIPLELRIHLTKGSIEGKFKLQGVLLRRQKEEAIFVGNSSADTLAGASQALRAS